MKYKIVEGSQSLHCCFDYTIVDTTKPLLIGGEPYKDECKSVCETFDKESAELICNALNKVYENTNP